MTETCDVCGRQEEGDFLYLLVGDHYQESFDDMEEIAKVCLKCFLEGRVIQSKARFVAGISR